MPTIKLADCTTNNKLGKADQNDEDKKEKSNNTAGENIRMK